MGNFQYASIIGLRGNGRPWHLATW